MLTVDLNTVWFVLVGMLFTGYAILDGFDLGVGGLHLFARGDDERRIFLNSIGPVWDGNEVWLVTGGGALFAAFPEVYATVFSGFYDLFMLLLAALIFRAVAIEFRSERENPGWRSVWDVAFCLSSVLSALLIGVIIGNIAWGVPLDHARDFQGDLFTLLHPYTLLAGITVVALFLMHGNIHLILKTEGVLQDRLRGWAKATVSLYLTCFVGLNAVTLIVCPHIDAAVARNPKLFGSLFLFAAIATFNIAREVSRRSEGRAFLSSCLSIIGLMALFGLAMYPTMVFSRPEFSNSLNIYNAASTPTTLRFMFYIALVGVPIVLAYTSGIYYVFRGKVRITDESY